MDGMARDGVALVGLVATDRPADRGHWASAFPDGAVVRAIDHRTSLVTSVAAGRPGVLMLDGAWLAAERRATLAELADASPGTRIVVLDDALADRDEIALVMAGVHGCCLRDLPQRVLARVIEAVSRGELWVRRKVMGPILEQVSAVARIAGVLGESQVAAARARLADLTPRERAIAGMVGRGQSNKVIARRLAISEGTVKAHVTQIYRKTGLDDRMKIALVMAGAIVGHDETDAVAKAAP